MPALLEPAALAWRGATWLRRAMATPYRSRLPVICIGNPTAGGAGKTPTAIAIGRLLQEMGERPIFLTRGYGGRIAGPHLVDASGDGAEDVGDEALLLARVAQTVVCGDRAAGARFIEALDASVIVMDDGFHNPGLAKDLSILVVDKGTGIGNGQVIPAGPLREGLTAQLARANALLLVGTGNAAEGIAAQARHHGQPVLEARLEPAGDERLPDDEPILAFAGIGHPGKFFRDLEAAGARLERTIRFADHHSFSEEDARRLLAESDRLTATLLTTEKDWVRLRGRPGVMLEALRKRARPWPIRLTFAEKEAVQALVKQALEARRGA